MNLGARVGQVAAAARGVLFGPRDSNFDGLEAATGPVSFSQLQVKSVVPTGGLSSVTSGSGWGWIRETFSGAWQRNIQPESPQNILAFSAVYACVTLIADDISKLRIKLVEQNVEGIWDEVTRTSSLGRVLRKPNRYQTRIQFLQQWLASKLLHGNAYILKERDTRGVVTALYPLNPFYVMPLVASDSSVWYQINRDILVGAPEGMTVPASEIIHDRCCTLWHPLVGVSPIYACGASATQGIRIQANSKTFFENMSRPSGHLSAPGTISDERLETLKKEIQEGFSGNKIGRFLVTGDGMKFESMTMPASDAQLIEQLKWTVEDVARAFKVPLYKLGGALPASFNSVAALNQDYYSQTLQSPIESLELLLEEGLGLVDATTTSGLVYGVEVDLDGLLRMDPLGRAETDAKEITAAILAPNEARKKRNLKSVKGGDTPYLQKQNYSLAALDARDKAGPPTDKPTAPPPPSGVNPPPPPPPEPSKGQLIEGVEFHKLEEEFADLANNAPLLEEAA